LPHSRGIKEKWLQKLGIKTWVQDQVKQYN